MWSTGFVSLPNALLIGLNAAFKIPSYISVSVCIPTLPICAVLLRIAVAIWLTNKPLLILSKPLTMSVYSLAKFAYQPSSGAISPRSWPIFFIDFLATLSCCIRLAESEILSLNTVDNSSTVRLFFCRVSTNFL